MITRNVNKLTFYQFKNLYETQGLKHFTSTRLGGVSKNHLESLNLGYTVNDKPEFVDKNIDLLAEATGISKSCMVFPKQTNGTNIAIVKSVNDVFFDTDALITDIAGICIGVRTADCVPVLIYEPERRIIAAVHSGWKGTVEKIAKSTIEIMVNEFGANPQKMIAGIGPSISPAVYEVGSDVISLVKQAFGNENVLKHLPGSEKALFDLWQANKIVLTESGIPASNIEIAEMCTFSNPDLFYSARRDKPVTGRLATGIMMV